MADREEPEKAFKVVDRRRFTNEGETRADAPPDSVRRPDPPPEAPPPPRPEPGAAKGQPRGAPRGGAEPGIDFLTFVASLATNALGALGALPEGQAQGMPVSPQLAREYIDILAMLQEKTRGNLTDQEDKVLQRLVTDLRLNYVEMTGSGGGARPGAPAGGGKRPR